MNAGASSCSLQPGGASLASQHHSRHSLQHTSHLACSSCHKACLLQLQACRAFLAGGALQYRWPCLRQGSATELICLSVNCLVHACMLSKHLLCQCCPALLRSLVVRAAKTIAIMAPAD